MKSLYKLILFFGLVMLISSCSSDKNSLTKNYILEHLGDCEVKKPNILSYAITKSSYNVPIDINTTINNPGVREYKHLMKLVRDGYIKSEVLTAEGTDKSYDSYTFSILPKSKPFVLKENRPNSMRFIMYETKAYEVEKIEILDDVKANVTVKYKKIKTPFYIADYDVSTNKNIPVKPDVYTETIVFRKSYTNGWIYCQL